MPLHVFIGTNFTIVFFLAILHHFAIFDSNTEIQTLTDCNKFGCWRFYVYIRTTTRWRDKINRNTSGLLRSFNVYTINICCPKSRLLVDRGHLSCHNWRSVANFSRTPCVRRYELTNDFYIRTPTVPTRLLTVVISVRKPKHRSDSCYYCHY